MDEQNTILLKSKTFAIRIVHLYNHLQKKHETVLSNQLLRAGTSIGANVAEAICGISKKDFLAKMYIAYKECSESLYWIDLLHDTKYISEQEFASIRQECQELYKILSSITKTSKESIENS